jgi:monothiol glutaredoxin
MGNPFEIINNKPNANVGSPMENVQGTDLKERIHGILNASDVVVLMKGTPDYPQCGFSANTVKILNHLQVPFKSFNILSDQSIREGIKVHSNWPTYPQIYFNGKLLGGNDIITEMFENGELETLLKKV